MINNTLNIAQYKFWIPKIKKKSYMEADQQNKHKHILS
jgi:hypothetical protein